MTRKERKAAAEKRRNDILVEIAEKAKSEIEKGATAPQAIVNVDRWLQEKVKQNPQERTLYMDAAVRYMRMLKG